MGTTTGGLPYPEPSDPVAEGANAIKALAQAIDPKLSTLTTDVAARVRKAGDSMSGALSIDLAAAATALTINFAGVKKLWVPTDGTLRVLAPGRFGFSGSAAPLHLVGNTSGPYVAFYDGADVDNLGNRRGYMGFVATHANVVNEQAGGNLNLNTQANITFLTAGAEAARFTTAGDLLHGKTSTSNDVAGVRISATGNLIATTDAVSSYNLWCVKVGAANAAGQAIVTFRATAATQIGSISMATATTVAYNTTSHGPWKTDVADLDPGAAVAAVMALRPRSFRWKVNAAGNPTETGTPAADVSRGFVAQELAEVAPHAVTPGYGNEADMAGWLERQAEAAAAEQAFTEPEPFLPWGTDVSKLIPDLVAALQSALRRIETLEAAA